MSARTQDRGLFAKFRVERLTLSSRGIDHTDCRYFVLDITHDPHALPAALAYADSCKSEYPFLAQDIRVMAQTKPARIPEPKPGKRVTACVMPTPDHPETFLHLRLRKLRNETPYDWACLATGHCYMWDSLIDPTLIREGVTS